MASAVAMVPPHQSGKEALEQLRFLPILPPPQFFPGLFSFLQQIHSQRDMPYSPYFRSYKWFFHLLPTTQHLSRSIDIQFSRHIESPNSFVFSNTRLNASLSGISFGSSANYRKPSWSIPNSSMQAKSSPAHITVHSPMIRIYSNSSRIFP